MSGVARVNERLLTDTAGVKPPVDPTTLRVNLKKHPVDMHQVGGKVHFQGHGHITAIHKDGFGHRMEIDVKKMTAGKMEMPQD